MVCGKAECITKTFSRINENVSRYDVPLKVGIVKRQ